METKSVPLKSILITDPIVKAAKQINPQVNVQGFKKQPGSQGFALSRINENKNVTGTPPAILVKPYGNTGYYEIIDGRHRVTNALVENKENINAQINNGGKRRRKTKRRKMNSRVRK